MPRFEFNLKLGILCGFASIIATSCAPAQETQSIDDASHSTQVMPSKRETEREISKAIIRFEKEFMGRGPLDAKSFVIEDMVLIRLKNVLTPAELKLAEAENHERGRYLIKQMRQELIERGRPLLDAVIKGILDVDVVSLHTDISAKTGERIIVFTLAERPEFD